MIRTLRPALGGLLVWTALAWAQRPPDADAAALIERSRQKALDYAKSLPDFECTEVVRRYTDADPQQERFRPVPIDKLAIKLRYFQHKEEHKLVLIDDQPADRTFESLDGAIGTGEFGATLSAIFDPASQTSFHWESWKNGRKRRTAVYAYIVEPAHSRYLMIVGATGTAREAVVGYHGALEIDSETGEVLHFAYVADHIPKELVLKYASTTVDYDLADIGGRDYLLPVRSEARMGSPGVSVRNEIEFREYRKFSADSSIDYGPAK
jgi:hypothetical protein